MFLDASAVVAILAGEADSRALVEKLEAAAQRLTSPLSKYEAVLAINRVAQPPGVESTSGTVDRFLDLYRVRTIDITSEIGDAAIAAFEKFGKGRHKARLNMGDCFSYACAKLHRVPLLCKGNDFQHTDINIA